jgi:hypothetical protein
MDLTAKIAAQRKLSEARNESFKPYDIDLDAITDYLLGGEEDEQD